jgi:hypothetical protein
MQIVQLVGLTLFGIFKCKGKDHLPFHDLVTTLNFLHNVDHIYLKIAKTLTPPNIWAAFQAVGVKFDMRTASKPSYFEISFTGNKRRNLSDSLNSRTPTFLGHL